MVLVLEASHRYIRMSVFLQLIQARGLLVSECSLCNFSFRHEGYPVAAFEALDDCCTAGAVTVSGAYVLSINEKPS
jgi:hypothetical protein